MQWYMLTVAGGDRPGIVAALTEALYRGGANLGEAEMARLGGTFAIMLMVATGASAQDLEQMLAPVSDKFGLRLHVDPMVGELHRHVEPNVRVAVHGADRPGIVAKVTARLRDAGLNVLDLWSDVGGTADRPFYVMLIEGRAEGGADRIRTALADLPAGGIEVRVEPIDTLIG